MGRKPNYRADRIERERAKASKKAKRMEAKIGKSAKQSDHEVPVDQETSEVSETADDVERGEPKPS